MKKLKICVYAICKNEEQFVERWMECVKEADYVVVLDTGSADKTVELLKKMGAMVTVEEIKPWRFDVARNKSLDLVPKNVDVCLAIDLDEIIEIGWRKKLEKIWEKGTNRISYNYIWSFDEQGNPAVNFYIEKCHDRHNYKWKHPVHEVLQYIGKKEEIKKQTDEITVKHYPDNSKPRSQYLPLLELAVEEDPLDDRNMHYLGREYMFTKNHLKAIETLHKHLSLERATWKEERAASMRFLGRCYKELNYMEESRMWFEKAIIECPTVREGFVELALFEYEKENYSLANQMLKKALKIEERNKVYINEDFCWDSTIYDILSICSYNLGFYEEAYGYITKAIILNPKIERLKKNKEIISEKAQIKT